MTNCNRTKYLELWRLWDNVKVRQLFSYYLRWIWRRGVQLDFVRDLRSELPGAVSKLTADMSRDQFNSDVVVGPGHDLEPETQ